MFTNFHLESVLNKIYDHLYANSTIKTPTGIAEEVIKILNTINFLEENNRVKLVELAKKVSIDNLHESKDLEKYIADEIKSSFLQMNKKLHLFNQNQILNLSNFDIHYVYKNLIGINISNSYKDVFGDAMEVFRSYWSKTHGGQFFTDQRVTNLAIQLLKFNPTNGEDLIDICAGTGGFLLAGLNRIKKASNNSNIDFQKYAINCLKGIEIDAEICNIGNRTISSRIGNNSIKIIENKDSLLFESFNGGRNSIKFNSHYCAATNPPFGTKITIKNSNILKHYELAKNNKNSNSKVSFRAPDILFIEQNIKLLKPEIGRLAIVVPYQIVSGPQALYVREWILLNAQILSIIDLPPETFQPHTGTKASLIVLKRRRKPLKNLDISNDPPIFMSSPKWIGHDRRGNPVFKRAIDGSLTEEILTDFPDVIKAFQEFDSGRDPEKVHAESISTSAAEIIKSPNLRFDARFYIYDRIQKKNFNKDKYNYFKIKDLVQDIFYPGRFSRNYVNYMENSVPFLGGTNIAQLILNTDKRLSINNTKIKNLIVKKGWLLITRSGTVGIISLVPENWDGFAVSEHVIRIVPNPKILPVEYLYAILRTKYFQKKIRQGVYGSVIDEITPEHIGNIDIPVPKSKVLLSKIVDKINDGEKARQKAIELLNIGVDILEKEL